MGHVSDVKSTPPIQVSCRNVWKVFGRGAEKIPSSPKAELSRAELLATEGCTIAVRDVSFEIPGGEVFVVMGLSGSGKSTLTRCITRLINVTSGEVELCGRNVVTADAKGLRELRRTKVSMVFQHFALLPHRNVLDNVAYGLEVKGVDKHTRHERARLLLEVVGLSGMDRSYPSQLSGGMQQRVGLARALAVDPDVLIFDEAFSALDPLIRRGMQDELVRLQQQMHKTVIFVTHDLDEALKLGDRIAIMRDGAFVQLGTPEEVVGNPADDYVAAFTRDVPRAKVLTAAWVMRPLISGLAPARSVAESTKLDDVLGFLAERDEVVGVVDSEGRVVGTLDRATVLQAVVAAPPHPDTLVVQKA
ncbi:MAG: betaine/proline/choline family ABC transporter ATP-binding protein [Acidimicrobiales bacterium]